MIKLKLPFEFVKVVEKKEEELVASELVKEAFGIALENAEMHECENVVAGDFYHCKQSQGFTLVAGGHFKVMALNLDGEVDGVYKDFSDTMLISQNHPGLVLHIGENCRVWSITGAQVEAPFDPAPLEADINGEYLSEDAIDKLNLQFAESSAMTIQHFSKIQLSIKYTVRVGPADYRSFRVESKFNKVCHLLTSHPFIRYLTEVTGLSLGKSSFGNFLVHHGLLSLCRSSN